MITFLHDEYGEWVQMYLDDKLVVEGHSIDPYQVCEALNIGYKSIEITSTHMEAISRSNKTLREALQAEEAQITDSGLLGEIQGQE